jgi:hypothetical protein
MRRHWIALILTALLVGAAGCSGGDDESAGSVEAGGGEAVVAEDSEGAAAEGELVDQPVTGGERGSVLPSLGPRVIQTAAVTLSIPRNEFQDAVDRARTIATGLGGFVVGSSASQGREGRLVRGTLVLRVPERGYAQAMRSLAALGRVESREESGQDVSQEFVDLEARTRHLEAVETQLLELLRRAGTVASALAVQSRLNEVQLQLEQVRGRARFLEDQVAFATISLGLAERRAEARDDGGWQVVEAWRDGAEAFVFVAGRIFVVLATVAPVALLLAVAFLAARFARRRRLLRA